MRGGAFPINSAIPLTLGSAYSTLHVEGFNKYVSSDSQKAQRNPQPPTRSWP